MSKDATDKVCLQIWKIRNGLNGLGTLFEQVSNDPFFDKDDLFGISQLLRHFAKEVSQLEDLISCGDDLFFRFESGKKNQKGKEKQKGGK